MRNEQWLINNTYFCLKLDLNDFSGFLPQLFAQQLFVQEEQNLD